MDVLVVNFSGRISNGKGNGIGIGKFIIENFGNKSVLINYSDKEINSCNGCDYDCFYSRSNCKYFNDDLVSLYDVILQFKHIYYIIPVYSDFPCSNYFAFRERGQCYFNDERYELYSDKQIKFIVLANTGYNNVQNIIKNDFPHTKDSHFLRLGSSDYGLKSADGNLMNNNDVRRKIRDFIAAN